MGLQRGILRVVYVRIIVPQTRLEKNCTNGPKIQRAEAKNFLGNLSFCVYSRCRRKIRIRNWSKANLQTSLNDKFKAGKHT